MQRIFTKYSANFKGILFLLALSLIVGALWYTQQLVNTLKEKSTEYISFRIKVFEENINNPNADIDVGFFFNEVIRGSDYPIIYTDTEGRPQSWVNISAHLDTLTILSREDSLLLSSRLDKMKEENEPLPITYQGAVLGYYYYGLSPEIYQLKNLPFIAIGAGIVFVLIAYLGFAYIKKSEQRNIWVGMAKETAHQLGTPLSSLSGWIELLRESNPDDRHLVDEMANDLKRLNKIATRFSKIGSRPNLDRVNLEEVIKDVTVYFSKRLPHIQKQVGIELSCPPNLTVLLNRDLFEWVLENMLKNAIDAIEKKKGKIKITAGPEERNDLVAIDIKDNGKGMNTTEKKNIFKPGYSTKTRGWGLGLSLAKRIIEEYHDGKLLLKETRPGNGTTFRILLKMPK